MWRKCRRQSVYMKLSNDHEIDIEILHVFLSCHCVFDGISGEELRRQNVDWVDGMWLGFVEWLVW